MNANRPSRLPWLILPAGCLTIVLIACGGFFAFVYIGVTQLLVSSEPYQHALLVLKQSAAVGEHTGQPIVASGSPTGSVHKKNGAGNADLQFSVSGPKGSGTVHVVAERQEGEWSYSTILFTFDDPSLDPLELARRDLSQPPAVEP